MEIIEFKDAIAEEGDEEKSVLLGNGFSRAYSDDIFNYNSLYTSSKMNDDFPAMAKVFSANKTKNFEKIIRILNSAAATVRAYECEDPKVATRISNDAKKLRDLLAETISEKHPNNSSDIEENKYVCCKKFLEHFENYFSLNYDLLLYWSLIKEYQPKLNHDDGFRRDQETDRLVWNPAQALGQNTFYLHGALHLFDKKTQLIKIDWNSTGIHLKEQILDHLGRDEYPLIVAEGTTEEKLDTIFHNRYLNYCYDRLHNLSGSLFVYGFSMDENDEHIIKKIENSLVTKLFVGLYGAPDSDNNRRIIDRTKLARASRAGIGSSGSLLVCFFDSETVSVWGG